MGVRNRSKCSELMSIMCWTSWQILAADSGVRTSISEDAAAAAAAEALATIAPIVAEFAAIEGRGMVSEAEMWNA